MSWLTLIAAGVVEVAWAQSIRPTANFTRPLPTAVCLVLMGGAVYLLSRAMNDIPVGTAYVVFTGIGAVGAIVLGVVVSSDPMSVGRIAALTREVEPADLGVEGFGERATLVHFSSAFCAPCRAARQVLTQVSATVPGVDHVEVDAESHLELVRRLGVRRTPTVLVLDADGGIRARASGLPRKAEVLAAIGPLVSRDDVP